MKRGRIKEVHREKAGRLYIIAECTILVAGARRTDTLACDMLPRHDYGLLNGRDSLQVVDCTCTGCDIYGRLDYRHMGLYIMEAVKLTDWLRRGNKSPFPHAELWKLL